MIKIRTILRILLGFVVVFIMICLVIFNITDRKRMVQAKENAIFYVQNTYKQKMVFKSQEYNFPEMVHFVNFYPENNEDIVFTVWLTGKDIHVWQDTYFEKKFEYELTEKIAPELQPIWGKTATFHVGIFTINRDFIITEDTTLEELEPNIKDYSIFIQIEEYFEIDERRGIALKILDTVNSFEKVGLVPENFHFDRYTLPITDKENRNFETEYFVLNNWKEVNTVEEVIDCSKEYWFKK